MHGSQRCCGELVELTDDDVRQIADAGDQELSSGRPGDQEVSSNHAHNFGVIILKFVLINKNAF